MFIIVKKRGLPQLGELVVCTISHINPHSVYVHIEEYNKEGMVHISEVSSGWVKDIRQHVKIGETVVAKVLRVEDVISLSLKRVDKRQENSRMKEFRLSHRAEKMLELVAKQLGKTLEQAYKEVGYMLQENYGSLYEAFRIALQNPRQLKERGVPEQWIQPLKEIAEKNIEQKEFQFKSRLFVRSIEPDGIKTIKKLLAAAESMGLSVHYIAAPNYLVKYKTKNAKKGEKEFSEKLETLSKLEKSLEVEAERG
ncbi:MAG: S1 RNA-binding domain-containing protein [Candidatus Aenigmarchaeota archaeon]|nr:S1 RNA-binding domain-containing protein [Candidatus Aenigmarchaeota archaeon]